MSLKPDLKNLVFTVLGSTIVAAVSFLFFSPSSEYQNKLTAEYRRAQISNAGRIVGDKALDALIASKDNICMDAEDKACNVNLVDLANKFRNYEYFQNRRYTVIHELTIRNETEFAVSDLEIEHSFAYPGYVTFTKSDKNFHRILEGSVFSVEELKPGKKVEAIFFSEAGYAADIDNINVTESGRILDFSPTLEAPDGNDPFAEELSSLFGVALRAPFTTFIVGMLSVLSIGLIVFVVAMSALTLVFPEWVRKISAKNMSEKEYLWQKSILDFYEETQKEMKEN